MPNNIGQHFSLKASETYARRQSQLCEGGRDFEMVPRMENEKGRTRRARRRFSAEEKTRIVGLYEQSGLARVEFCRRQGVSLLNLQRWLGKRRQSGEARFLELEARAIAEQGSLSVGIWRRSVAGSGSRI
jgi:Transposase